MVSQHGNPIYFGPFEVTSQLLAELVPQCPNRSSFPAKFSLRHLLPNAISPNDPQVFYLTPLSFALVNLKPLLPGHVLVSPHRSVPRLTDLTSEEVTDLFTTVQRVQRMLAQIYFTESKEFMSHESDQALKGSFNIAIQDGPDAGQSVPHLHCHIIPRLKGDERGDEIYDRMASEEGNVGGPLWDREQRPQGGGHFPKIEDTAREPRHAEVMTEEAQFFRKQMHALGF